MQKSIKLIALITLFHVYNVDAMEISAASFSNEAMQKAVMFEESLLAQPSLTLEMITHFIKTFQHEINLASPETGNTPLHDQVIQICWGYRPARLITLAALIISGANRLAVNKEGLTPLECAEYALEELQEEQDTTLIAHRKATVELLKEAHPTKQTLISLVKKHKLITLEPLLLDQQSHPQ